MAGVEADIIANTINAWYRRRCEEIANGPRRFTDQRIADHQLYYCIIVSKAIVSDIVEDLDI